MLATLAKNTTKEVFVAIAGTKISDGGIKIAFASKENSVIVIDLTFGMFKTMVGQIAGGTGAEKPLEEQMKMMFDQLKTQIANEVKNAKSKEEK